jgi:hypothetical protein
LFRGGRGGCETAPSPAGEKAVKIKALKRTCVPIGGEDKWMDAGEECEVSAEDVATIEGMGYVGEYVEVCADTKAKKGKSDA